jgi:hypothetical protein
VAVLVGAGVSVGVSRKKLLQLAKTAIAASAPTMIIAWYFFLFASIDIALVRKQLQNLHILMQHSCQEDFLARIT